MHLHMAMETFVSESQQAAELEEKRRYRFLAEKHQFLSNTFLQFYTRVRRGRGQCDEENDEEKVALAQNGRTAPLWMDGSVEGSALLLGTE